MKNRNIIGILLLFVFIFFSVFCITKINKEVEGNTEDLLCEEGSIIVRNSSELYYTIPNENYINASEKGIVGIHSKKEKHQMIGEGGEQLFAIENNIFTSISEHPALANYDATTYIISSKDNEIIHSFKGNVIYICSKSKLVFYIRNNYENKEKGGLFCCDIAGKNERKLLNGDLDYLGRDGEDLFFQALSNDKVEIVRYNHKKNDSKTVSKEKYRDGMKITDFEATNGIINYIYGHYEGQLGDFNGKIVSIFPEGRKNELIYEIMEPHFFVLDSKIYFCIYSGKRRIKYCLSLKTNEKTETSFDDMLLYKEDKDTYIAYKNINCLDKIHVNTKSGKAVEIRGDRLKKLFEIEKNKAYIKIRRMDVYEDSIYMNTELWESQADHKEKFIDRKLLQLDVENGSLREVIH